jgi:hypothetical protein
MIEIRTFRLTPDADEAAFIAADHRFQTDFAYQQAGLRRRTTARSGDGTWIIINLWRSEREADAAEEKFGHDPIASRFLAFIDAASVRTDRYTQLD